MRLWHYSWWTVRDLGRDFEDRSFQCEGTHASELKSGDILSVVQTMSWIVVSVPSPTWKTFLSQALLPDVISYNKRDQRLWIVSSVAEGGDATSGNANGANPSGIVTYTLCMSACGKGHQWELAVGLIDAVHMTSTKPDTILYNSAMVACEKSQQWVQALALLRRMQSEHLAPEIFSYNSVMSACETVAWATSLSLFQEAQEATLFQ